MALAQGTRVGPYEIVSSLGAGGMGEVYRARDTRLGRDVAVKTIAPTFTTDPDRVARFTREAQLLAALNHPHIATVHGLEQAGDSLFLIMELVDGDTLADRLRQGALPPGVAVPLAIQIAEALIAAHEKGIVHRDLKPANIALTRDGRVKVLDFGLAKLQDPAGDAGGSRPDVSASPTLSLGATQAGVILGTAAYMAPEQAKGRPGSTRSDIWAFGCVLYEMLAGRRPFDGQDAAETLASVLAREPDWAALPRETPPLVRTLLEQCLLKEPSQRLPDASTARFLLAPPASLTAPAAGVATRGGRTALLAGLAAAVVALAIVVGVLFFRPQPAAPVTRLVIATPAGAPLVPSVNDRDMAIAPDGSRVVYVGANSTAYVRSLDRLEVVPLPGLGSPRSFFFSPDGQWVGFFDGGSSTIRKVPITGGTPVVVSRYTVGNPRGAAWLADGTIVFATNDPATGLLAVADSGGEPRVLTRPDPKRGESEHLWPEPTPDGRGVVFTIQPTNGRIDLSELALLDLADPTPRVLLRGGTDGHIVASGHLVFASGSTLRAVPVDVDRAAIVGVPVVVESEVSVTVFGAAQFDVSRNGTLVYMTGGPQASARDLVWVDRQGVEEPVRGAPSRAYQYMRLSPDGTRVLLDIRDQENDIWLWSLLRQTLTRLTFDPSPDRFPVWSRDGTRIFYGSDQAGVGNVYVRAADGTGAPRRLTSSPLLQLPMTTSLDDRTLIVRESGQIQDLSALSLDGDAKLRPLIATPFAEQNAEISPDGRWIAYESNDSGQFEIFVRPYPAVDEGRWQVSSGGGVQALWSGDGRELFYLTFAGALMRVQVDAAPTWGATAPVKLFDGQQYHGGGPGGGVARTYDVAPDGKRFLMIKRTGGAIGPPLVVAQNWFEELKRLVPAD